MRFWRVMDVVCTLLACALVAATAVLSCTGM